MNHSKIQGFKKVTVDYSLVLNGCTGIPELFVDYYFRRVQKVEISNCDLERLKVARAIDVAIRNCSRIKELYIDMDTIFIDELSRFVCNCRELEKVVVVNARRVSYRVDSNREGDPIVTATFGSMSLKRIEINVEDKLSVGILPVPNDFAIGYEDRVRVACNNDKLRAYFKPVKFSDEIKELLCASVFAPLFYVKERVTVQFNSLLFRGAMVGNPLFRGGELRIPKEVEALQGSLGSDFPIKSLHLSGKVSVGDSVFKNTGLSEIVGSEHLTSVGALAFAGTKLSRLALGKEAKLSEFSFGGCDSLTSVGGLWDIKSAKRTAFALCNSLDSDTLGALYKKQWYMSTEELLSEYPERAYEKYVHREMDIADDALVLDEYKRFVTLGEEHRRLNGAEIARDALTKRNISEIYLSEEGELCARGLKGVSNGVNSYPSFVQGVTVDARTLYDSKTEVLDMSKCAGLKSFEVYVSARAYRKKLPSLSLIFPTELREEVGADYCHIQLSADTEELKFINFPKVAIFNKLIVDGAKIAGIDGAIKVEECEICNCTGLSELSIEAGAECGDLHQSVRLISLDTAKLSVTVDSLEYCEIGFFGLKYLKELIFTVSKEATNLYSFISRHIGFNIDPGGLETLVLESKEGFLFNCCADFASVYSSIKRLEIRGDITFGSNVEDEVIFVPKGCKVVCDNAEFIKHLRER